LGWVSQLMGWVGSGHTKWTHGQLWVQQVSVHDDIVVVRAEIRAHRNVQRHTSPNVCLYPRPLLSRSLAALQYAMYFRFR